MRASEFELVDYSLVSLIVQLETFSVLFVCIFYFASRSAFFVREMMLSFAIAGVEICVNAQVTQSLLRLEV